MKRKKKKATKQLETVKNQLKKILTFYLQLGPLAERVHTIIPPNFPPIQKLSFVF